MLLRRQLLFFLVKLPFCNYRYSGEAILIHFAVFARETCGGREILWSRVVLLFFAFHLGKIGETVLFHQFHHFALLLSIP